MKDYSDYTPLDFARDKDFFNWVKYPDRYPALGQFWQNWLRENPHKREELEEAKHLLQAILDEKYVASDAEQQEVWTSIRRTLQQDKKEVNVVRWWNTALAKAAVVLIAIGVSWAVWKFTHKPVQLAGSTIEAQAEGMETATNTGNRPTTIVLPDGTSIVLQPESTLHYAKDFSGGLREVYLKGEAFFEVRKDATRPFLVHTNEIVTRVIGTSFTVRNYQDRNIVVQVKTGKVSVFREKNKHDNNAGDSLVEGVVLTPNQQVEYEHDKMKLTKSLVENPALLMPVPRLDFEFSDAQVVEVFDLIEEAYGVDIVYDREVMMNCQLNASLSDVPLNDKINLICKAIHATYEIIDSQIVIYSKGCED